MEITLEQLLKGKSTKINNKDFLSTEDYVQSFIDQTKHLTDNYRIEAISPKQVTYDVNGEDITYNKVLIQAVLPTKYSKYNECISLCYALDIRKPIYKYYKSLFNNETGNIIAFNPEHLIIKEIKPNDIFAVNIPELIQLTTDYTPRIRKYENELLSTDYDERCKRLGQWIESSFFELWRTELGGKVKWTTANIIKVFSNLYIDYNSDYYVGDKDSTVLNTYEAFANIIANDKKDICNKYEKTMLINTLLKLWN